MPAALAVGGSLFKGHDCLKKYAPLLRGFLKRRNFVNVTVPEMRKSIEKYGEEDRTTVAMEEFAELIKAVSKYKRYILNAKAYHNDDRYPASKIRENVTEEMADALICIETLREIFGISEDELEAMVDKKVVIRGEA